MPVNDGRRANAGELIRIDFGQPTGHEQAGHRPGLVISSAGYNHISSLMLVCPITSNSRPWPFKVPFSPVGGLRGFILADQLRSIDPTARSLKRSGYHVPEETLAAVRGIIAAVIGVEVK